jgi:hypothetical protein
VDLDGGGLPSTGQLQFDIDGALEACRQAARASTKVLIDIDLDRRWLEGVKRKT